MLVTGKIALCFQKTGYRLGIVMFYAKVCIYLDFDHVKCDRYKFGLLSSLSLCFAKPRIYTRFTIGEQSEVVMPFVPSLPNFSRIKTKRRSLSYRPG